MDKELTVPKWVLMVRPKIFKMPQKFRPKMSARTQKFKIFEEMLPLGVRSPCPMGCILRCTRKKKFSQLTGI